MKNYHLAKEDEQWKLKQQGAERSSKIYSTKEEALKKAPDFVREQGGRSLKIHKENGRIQEERTYPKSADPTRSKG